MDRPYSLLFISRRNAARSLMAEAVVDRHGKGRFRAFGAAVDPATKVDPSTLHVLEQSGYPTKALRTKHRREFSEPGAPVLDFVFALSATPSREAFPDWPGKPIASHWRYPDPSKATGDECQRRWEFGRTLAARARQMRVLTPLSLARLDAIAPKRHLEEISTEQAEASDAQTS